MIPKRLLAFTLFAALAVMPPCVLRAQWQPMNGLYGGEIGSFATDGHTLFLSIGYGKQGAIFQSTNGGLSWSENKQGLADNDNLLYLVGSSGIEVFATDGNDVGYYWSNDSAKWVETAYLREPSSFAYKDTDLFEAFPYDDIERSTNNGLTWAIVDTGLNQEHLFTVAAFAVIDSFLFAGTDYSGVFRSSDNGDHWARMDSTDDTLGITCFLVSGENLFAAAGGYVLLSTDYGENWKDVSNGLPDSSYAVNALAEMDGMLFAGTHGGGIYISSNNGSSWQDVSTGTPAEYINALTVIGDTLFAGTPSGVFLSTNTGQTWNDANNGLIPIAASSLIIAGNTLYASGDLAGDDLLYHTNDSGIHWRVSKDSVSTQTNYFLEGFSSIISQGPNIYACNFGVFLTTDSGAFWVSRSNGLPVDGVNCLAVEGTKLFAGTSDSGVYVSTDSGANWGMASGGLPPKSCVASLCVNGNYIVAGLENGAGTTSGVFFSSDDGKTWTSHNNGFPSSGQECSSVISIDTFVFAEVGGLFRSSIHDTAWTDLAFIGGSFATIDTMLFAGTSTGLFESFDYGDNWGEVDSGITYPYILSLAVYDSMLFAGTYVGYPSIPTIWRRPLSEMSTSPHILGASADTINFGNIPVGTDALRIDTVTNVGKSAITIRSFQLTPSQGVFSTSDLSGEVELNPGESFTFEAFFMPTQVGAFSANIGIISEAKAINIVLVGSAGSVDGVEEPSQPDPALTIAPNPFSQSTQITFTSQSAGYAEVSIVNMLGVEVARLFSGELGAGEHSFSWSNLAGLQDGVYECLVRMNEQVQTLPVVLMR